MLRYHYLDIISMINFTMSISEEFKICKYKRSAGVAPVMTLKNPLYYKQVIHQLFKAQHRCRQKSKTGLPVAAPKKDDVLQKCSKKFHRKSM